MHVKSDWCNFNLYDRRDGLKKIFTVFEKHYGKQNFNLTLIYFWAQMGIKKNSFLFCAENSIFLALSIILHDHEQFPYSNG